jgi:hypothetical protein
VWVAYHDANDNLVAAVLVESKVASGFQPNQAEDYASEVAAWRTRLGNTYAAGILVAPHSNFRLDSRDHFDAFVAIDDMAEFLKARRDRLPNGELRDRLAIRVDLLEALAGKRPNSQWNAQPIAEKVNVAEAYDRLVREHLPGYRASPTVAGSHSGDRFFSAFPGRTGFNGGVHLKHRLYDGVVCLEFRRSPFTDAMLKDLLPQDGSIRPCWTGRTGNTLQLQTHAPPLDASIDATSQQPDMLQAFEAIKRLAAWLSEYAPTLNRMLAA